VTADANFLWDEVAVFLGPDKRYTRYISVAILSLRNPESKYKQQVKEMATNNQKGKYVEFYVLLTVHPCMILLK
jgi:hypothetical protein